VAAQDGERLRGVGDILACTGASTPEVTIDDCYLIATTGKKEGSGKTGRVAA